MKFLKGIFNFYINSSMHVAIAVCALALVTAINFQVPLTKTVLAFLFLATITGYNFVKYAGVAKFHYMSLTKNLRIIQLFSFLCFVLLLYVTSLLSKQFLWATAALGMITFFYAVPFLPKNKSLRNLKTLKIFVIAWVWSGTAVILPLINYKSVFTLEIMLTVVQYYVFILAIMIPFEIRDLSYDKTELGTFPQLIGVKKSKWFACLLLLVFVSIEFFLPSFTFNRLVPVVVIALISGMFVYFSKLKQHEYYASFWVEGVPMYWLFLVLLFRVVLG